MRVEVEFTTRARQQLLVLVSARVPTKDDAVQFAELYVEDIELQFQKYEGVPPGAEERRGANGKVWWWHYADGIWTVYRKSIRTARFFRPATVFIRVISFRARRPGP